MPMCEEAVRVSHQVEAVRPASTPREQVAELLLKAAFRVGQPEAWCQHYLGRLKDGAGTYTRKMLRGSEIHSRCMLGALYCEYDIDSAANIHAAYDAIVRAIGTAQVAGWNDAAARTQDEVVAALVRASEIAEAA